MTATAEIPPTRAEINRRNAQRSTGPKSQAGKERSRFNALKHGCRARLPILPGEDPDAYQDRLDAWIDKFQPRDAVETYMVERAVHASWQLDRADRAEVAAMVEAADEQALQRARDVLELGETLFRAPARVRGGDPDGVRGGDGDDQEPPLSWPFDPEHPRHPAHVVDELEGTAQGCTWLLQRWAALGEALDGGRTWRAVNRLRAIRLLGKQPLDAVADETVLSIYLACQAMDPQGPDVFAEPLSDLRRPEAAAAYQRQAERFAAARAERSPRDAAAGRAALRAIVSAAVARVEALREDRAAAEAEAAGMSEVSARLSYRAKETVDWLWKHQARCSRSLCRTFDELRKVRRDFGDDLPASPGPLSDVRGPSSGSELVEGSDLLATGSEPAAVEPAGDHDARDVTDEAIALIESFSVTKDHGQQTMDRTNEAIAPPEPPPVTTDHGPETTDPTNEASAPAELPPATMDNGPPTMDQSNEAIAPAEPLPVTGGRRTADQKVIVLALLTLLFSTVVAAAFGNWVPARALTFGLSTLHTNHQRGPSYKPEAPRVHSQGLFTSGRVGLV